MKYKKTNMEFVKKHFMGLKAIRYEIRSWQVQFRPASVGFLLTHTIMEHFFYDKKNFATYIVMWDEGFFTGLGYYDADRLTYVCRIDGKALSEDDLNNSQRDILMHVREELFNAYEKDLEDRRKEKES